MANCKLLRTTDTKIFQSQTCSATSTGYMSKLEIKGHKTCSGCVELSFVESENFIHNRTHVDTDESYVCPILYLSLWLRVQNGTSYIT